MKMNRLTIKKYLFKFIIICSTILVLSGCSLFSSYKSNFLYLNILADAKTNNGKPFTIIVERDSKYSNFVIDDYSTLSKRILNDNVSAYVIDPNTKTEKTFKILVNDKPIAIYFIFRNVPDTPWKYFYKKAKGEEITFKIVDNDITESK